MTNTIKKEELLYKLSQNKKDILNPDINTEKTIEMIIKELSPEDKQEEIELQDLAIGWLKGQLTK